MEQNEKHSYALWIIVAIVLTAILVGGGVYYWQNKKATETKNDLNNQITNLQNQINTLKSTNSTSTTPTSNSTNTTNSSTASNTVTDDDLLNAKKTVDAYLSYFSKTGPTINGVTKPSACSGGVSSVDCASLKALRTSALNTYTKCLISSGPANDVNSGLLINADPVLGIQALPTSYTIVDANSADNQITVNTTLNYDSSNPPTRVFYLTKENGTWLINATSVTNGYDAASYGCTR